MRAVVESLIEDANPPRVPGRIRGIFVPYGPLIEFGSSAGFAYKALLNDGHDWPRVLMLAPTPIQTMLPAVDAAAGYDTFVGPLDVEDGLRRAWLARSAIEIAPDPEPIHEMHAHFLLTALGKVAALPLRVTDGATLVHLHAKFAAAGDLLVVCCCNLPAPLTASIGALGRLFEPTPPPATSLKQRLFGARPKTVAPAADFSEPELHLAREAALVMRALGANALVPVSPAGNALVAYAA
jgi:hypothetical protein